MIQNLDISSCNAHQLSNSRSVKLDDETGLSRLNVTTVIVANPAMGAVRDWFAPATGVRHFPASAAKPM